MRNKCKEEKTDLLENTYSFLEQIHIGRIKQGADKKADIVIQIHDVHTGYDPVVGFSVKSFIGSNPTLFNAGTATHFVYKIDNMNISDIERINSIGSPTERYAEIFSNNRNLQFVGMDSKTFHDNLVMIDSAMPMIMSDMLIAYYSGKASSCLDMVEYMNSTIIANTQLPELFLEYKFKEFLCAVALGMQPATAWNGKDEANGGYIIVKRDGNIVAYHLYNRDFFKEYLFKRTKFEKPDSRIEYGTLYEIDGKVHIKLTLQIRFR